MEDLLNVEKIIFKFLTRLRPHYVYVYKSRLEESCGNDVENLNSACWHFKERALCEENIY